MNQKTGKKILSITLDVFLGLIVLVLLIVCISALSSKDKAYTSFFGRAVFAVETDSMTGNYKGSFDEHALLFSKPLTIKEAETLKVGDVITFKTKINGVWALNTHRIVGIDPPTGCYITRGDKTGAKLDDDYVSPSAVVSLYYSKDFKGSEFIGGKVNGVGGFIIFAQSPTGFFVVVVIPALLIFGYCIYAFVVAIMRVKNEMSDADKTKLDEQKKEEEKAVLKEQLRKELLQEFESPKDKPE